MNIALPLAIKPMLAQPGQPFDSPDYLFEPKWDGIRCIAFVGESTRLQSRNLRDITSLFPELANLREKVKGFFLVLDGEIVTIHKGKVQFSGVQKRIIARNPGLIKQMSSKLPATYVVFDILYHNGRSLLDQPLIQRKCVLAESLPENQYFVISPYILETGIQLHQACQSQSFEGTMAKLQTSPYLPGQRSRYWIKCRATHQVDCVIVGYTNHAESDSITSLLLAVFASPRFRYIGSVGTGFTEQQRIALFTLLSKLKTQGTEIIVPQDLDRTTNWVKPVLVCTVEYLEVTPTGNLRHPVFIRMRTDKEPEECQENQLWAPNK